MEIAEAAVVLLAALFYIFLVVLSGFFIYWTGRILVIIPDRLTRITEAFEKIAKKLGEQ